MGEKYQDLVRRVSEVQDLNMVEAVLSWDQETAMPRGGAEARAKHMSTLSRLSHEMFTSDTTGELLERAADEVNGAEYDSDEASMIRIVQHDYAERTKLPSDFVAELTRETALAHHTWAEARAKSEFNHFLPALERLIDLTRRSTEYLGYKEQPYDALLGQYERGITTRQVAEIFEAHRPALVELIAAINSAKQVDNSFLHANYPINQQRDFGKMVVTAYGFDFNRGMQAISVHPFCTHFSANDVRITTRYSENYINESFFGFLHEAGHGMYEQGVAQHLDGTPLGGGTSLGVHESQSRLWENIVGRSREFWIWALPQMQAVFPAQLAGVDVEKMYRAVNRVEPSFIRVEADEATYNLHIILRFELEQAIINGSIEPKDLPEAWNSRFKEFFGITPPNDAKGVLQDVHWSAGLMGYFATYALGNLLSAQYYNAALRDHPTIPDEIAEGKFDTLRGWMNTKIHQHGRKYTGDELTRRITGEGIQSRDYIQYLQTKYSDVYGL